MLNLVLFNINIFRKFEKYDSQIHVIMGGLRLVQPRCHSLSTFRYIALSVANTKAQHLGLNTCHWKKKFPKKKDLENVPYNQCPLSDLSPLVWKE